MSEYSETAAFWLFNRVTNFCYLRYDSMIKDLQNVQQRLEYHFYQEVKMNSLPGSLSAMDDEQLTYWLNGQSRNMAHTMMDAWRELDHFLLVRYIDGNVKHVKDGKIETTETGVVKFPVQPKYPDWFYKAIVDDHGDVIKAR